MKFKNHHNRRNIKKNTEEINVVSDLPDNSEIIKEKDEVSSNTEIDVNGVIQDSNLDNITNEEND